MILSLIIKKLCYNRAHDLLFLANCIMPTFQEILATLPSIDHLSGIYLKDSHGKQIAEILNQPGSAGSVRVYYALAQQFDLLDKTAAHQGLAWYAEHTADAHQFPGKHPNIDRLLALENGACSTLYIFPIAK